LHEHYERYQGLPIIVLKTLRPNGPVHRPYDFDVDCGIAIPQWSISDHLKQPRVIDGGDLHSDVISLLLHFRHFTVLAGGIFSSFVARLFPAWALPLLFRSWGAD
jgi:hypothetical protein